jgi:hypothetical protein
MTTAWASQELEQIDGADELQIATNRADGTLRRWVPIWVVRVDGQVYVRTWYRRDDGWFGHALNSRRARIRVPGLEVDVAVEDVGAADEDLRAAVNAAYRAKYGRYGGASVDGMTTGDAETTTLRLSSEQ